MRMQLKWRETFSDKSFQKALNFLTDKCCRDDADSSENVHYIQPNSYIRNPSGTCPLIINEKLSCVETKFKNVVDERGERSQRKSDDEKCAETKKPKPSTKILCQFSSSQLTQTAKPFPSIHGTNPSCSTATTCNLSSIDCTI